MVNPTQRSPRVPPVNKATWSFESILPRERKSLKAPEQGSQPVQVSKETRETQNLGDLDGGIQKEFRKEQSTPLSDLSATASASLELRPRVENKGDDGDDSDDHVSVTGATRESESSPDRGGKPELIRMQRDRPGWPEPGVSSGARGANQELEATIQAARPLQALQMNYVKS